MGLVCAKLVAATCFYELWNMMPAHNCHILSQMVTNGHTSSVLMPAWHASWQQLHFMAEVVAISSHDPAKKNCKFLECSTMLYIQQALGYSTSRCILSLLGTV